MYIEQEVTTKKRAIALANQGFLFWRDEFGKVRHADVAKIKSSWGFREFFVCSQPQPKGFVK
jgi:hypothetical protein